MKYVVYKITNTLNFMIYIGAHATKDINDNYMGSGIKIKEAIKNSGISNFRKEILFVFDTKEEMLLKEGELVNSEFVSRKDTYNMMLGNGSYCNLGKVVVKDSIGNIYQVPVTSKKYINGELVFINTGMTAAIDSNGNMYHVKTTDPRLLSGELTGHMKGKVTVKDKNDNIMSVSKNDTRYLSGELVHHTKGLITVKDKNNTIMSVSKDDPRYLSGELVHHSKGRRYIHHKSKKLKKMVQSFEISEYLENGWELGYK